MELSPTELDRCDICDRSNSEITIVQRADLPDYPLTREEMEIEEVELEDVVFINEEALEEERLNSLPKVSSN